MVGCPWLKALLVRVGNFTLYHLARLPTRDASNGFRLFSRRTMDEIVIESDRGFCYSIELLVKCHRLGWQVGEVPAHWFERSQGSSRFQVLGWLPAYLRWYAYAFATTYLRRPARTVRLKPRGLTRDGNHGRGLAEDQSPAHHDDFAVDGDHRAGSRIQRPAQRPSSITRSASRITSPSSRARRTARFRSCGNTVRRWSASHGNCPPAWSNRARRRPRPASAN